jgi:secernin
MDLVRLGLERGKTAHEALDVITGILQLYGQFGSGLPTEDLLGAYHNSFIIADPAEAWVLETAGTRWVAKKILSGSTSISNKLSIGAEWDLGSPDIVEYALGKGWWHDDSTHVFDFSRAYSDGTPDIKERDRRAAIRAGCSQDLLTERVGDITVSWMKRIARDRSTTPSIDLDQTASSCVAALPARQDGLPVFWWCPGPPSSSCYVPFFVHGAGLPPIVSEAGTYGSRVVPPRKALPDSFSESSYWWRFRDLCNLVNLDWKARNPVVRSAFDELEQAFDAQARIVMAEAAQLREAGKIDEAGKALGDFSAECTEQALLKTDELRSRFRSEPIEIKDEYASHVGTYIGSFGAFQDAEFQVLVRNGRLAVDIPGQMVVELKDADAEGLRYFTVTDAAAVSFAQDDSGKVTAMTIHQVITMPRKAEDPERVSQGAPDEYSPFVGAYTIPPGIAEMTVLVENDHLALNIPQRGTIELRQPDAKGRWFFADDDMTSVSFESDDAGKVNAMKLYQVFILPRK